MLNGPQTPEQNASRISWKQVIAFRLSRHHLSVRAPASGLISVVADIAGAQAQLLSAAQVSIWARVRDIHFEDVETALWRDRTLARAWCMRSTMYLLPSEDLAVFVRGSARRAEKEIRWMRSRGVSDRTIQELMDAMLQALEQPCTQSLLAERVSKCLGSLTRFKRGGGWGRRTKVACVQIGDLVCPAGYLLHVLGARGIVCSGPNLGNESTFVRADKWLARLKDVKVLKAERELLRRYLRAFGPSTPSDFALWTGMRLSDAKEIWSRLAEDIVQVDVEGWKAAVLRADLSEIEDTGPQLPVVRLLPYFDSFLLGHKERDHIVERRNHSSVYRAQGWVSPVLLVDGHAKGVWAQTRHGKRLSVRIRLFGRIPRSVSSRLREEASDLGRFLGCSDVDTKVI